jgi:centromere/kinetochore protein ZW10
VPCKLLLCNIRVVQFLQAVPNETSEFAEFQELAQLTADFETSLGRASLIPEWKETEGDKLRRFSTDVELHFAVKKRKQVVAKARNLLVVSDYKTFLVIMLHKLVLGKNLFYLAVSD